MSFWHLGRMCVLGGGVVYVCFVLFVMWAFFMCILSPSVSVCGGGHV